MNRKNLLYYFLFSPSCFWVLLQSFCCKMNPQLLLNEPGTDGFMTEVLTWLTGLFGQDMSPPVNGGKLPRMLKVTMNYMSLNQVSTNLWLMIRIGKNMIMIR